MRHDERRLTGCEALVGVDEAGRGALFGPVTTAAVLLRANFFQSAWYNRRARHVNDSKQLAPELRAQLCDEIWQEAAAGHLCAAVASASVTEIEQRNILGATQLAMARALQSVFSLAHISQEGEGTLFAALNPVPAASALALIPIDRCQVLIDGKPLPSVGYSHEALVQGDAKSLAIAMASILAKVGRDREVERLDKLYPGYGLAEHKGYGTAQHRDAIVRLGPSQEHRTSFLRKLLASPPAGQDLQPEFDFAAD
jgi:ribonuclease HII